MLLVSNMGPTLRSQAAKDVKFPIVCTTDIDRQILKDLVARDDVVLVAKTDLSKLITGQDELDSFRPPFTEHLPEASETLRKFLDATKSKNHISRKAFVVLDKTTSEDKRTCQIATDGREDEDADGLHVAFRCTISSIPPALDAVQQAAEPVKLVRDLRGEAAMVGGVWEKQRVDEFRARPKRIHVGEYPVHDNWDEYSGPDSPFTEIPYYPVFQTAKIGLDTINLFLKETYDQDWGEGDEDEGEEKRAVPGVAFVSSIEEAPYHAGKATAPLESAPQVPSTLLGASAVECDVIARSRFPAEGSEMNYNRFIVIDEYTEKDKTVIIAGNNEANGQLLMSRCDFKGALISLVSMEETGLTLEHQCNEAVQEGPGIIHGP